MSPEESKRYIDAVSPVAASILSVNPKVKDDYEALLAAAQRYREGDTRRGGMQQAAAKRELAMGMQLTGRRERVERE